jgi:hypothetical protein
MAGADNRWWGPRSDFPWEEDALRHIHDQMPSAEPYRAWQTFTFTAQSGHVREVDLLMVTPAGLFLVEIKSHPGRADREPTAPDKPEMPGAEEPAQLGCRQARPPYAAAVHPGCRVPVRS